MKYAKKDIYSNDGILLLSKGEPMTEDILKKLNEFGFHDTPDSNATITKAVHDSQLQLEKQLQLLDDKLLNRSADVLNKILFESKTKPFWAYIHTLSNYVDWIYTHSINVSLISIMLATQMGQNKREIHNLALGSMLHDVGKLMVPRTMIQKKEELTSEEKFFMQQHSEIGFSMLQEQPFPSMITDIVLQHHERMDGSGYPNGRSGDQIPRHVQIVIVANTLDTMTSFRPYKEPCNIGMAIRVLKEAKKQYPQDIVELFAGLVA